MMEFQGDITAVLAFKNEGDEVFNTLKSIRETTKNYIPIIMYDDASDDGIDYETIVKSFNAEYYKGEKSIGSAGGKHFAVSKVKTKYFVLFDCHMRMYNQDWDIMLTNVLNESPNNIYCSQSIILGYGENGTIKNEDGKTKPSSKGAFVDLPDVENNKNYYNSKWLYHSLVKLENIEVIPCVLGGAYAISKSHWDYIRGFEGLICYGYEEPFISIKTYYTGNKCIIITNWEVGHIYRTVKERPFDVSFKKMLSNQIAMCYLFDEGNVLYNLHIENLEKKWKKYFKDAYNYFFKRKDLLVELKLYIKSITLKNNDKLFWAFNKECSKKWKLNLDE